MNHLVISFISPDRPGLVDTISNHINKLQGNWQTSSLHHLSGFFSGVIEVAIPEKNSRALIEQLEKIPDFKFNIGTAIPHKASNQANIILELTANDRAGIVQEISSIIHHQGGNLLKLVSTHESAPHSGLMLFKAKVTITVADISVNNLINALEDIADDLMVDISR